MKSNTTEKKGRSKTMSEDNNYYESLPISQRIDLFKNSFNSNLDPIIVEVEKLQKSLLTANEKSSEDLKKSELKVSNLKAENEASLSKIEELESRILTLEKSNCEDKKRILELEETNSQLAKKAEMLQSDNKAKDTEIKAIHKTNTGLNSNLESVKKTRDTLVSAFEAMKVDIDQMPKIDSNEETKLEA